MCVFFQLSKQFLSTGLILAGRKANYVSLFHLSFSRKVKVNRQENREERKREGRRQKQENERTVEPGSTDCGRADPGSHSAELPAPTGPRSCQSGRNPVGISPGFSWESHCRLSSPRRPAELGEAGEGGRERERRSTRGGRRRRERRRGAAGSRATSSARRTPLQILRESSPRGLRAPAALSPNFGCS